MRKTTNRVLAAFSTAALLLAGCDDASDTARDEPDVDVETTDEPGDAGDEADGVDDDQAAAGDTTPFDVVAVEDIGGGRINARVVIEGQPDAASIEATAHTVIQQLRERQPYSGATAFLYDHEAFIEGAFTLGRIEDAPGGEWQAAHGAPVGDYSNHEQTVEAYEKNWDAQPTDQEARLYAAWSEVYFELEEEAFAADPMADPAETEQEAFQQVASDEAVDAATVEEAVTAVSAWRFDGA